jgi:hypothetical protein
MHFLKVNEKPTNALIIQYTQYPPTCFGILKCRHQGVKHDLAEIGAKCSGKLRRMGACYNIQLPSFSASHNIGHLSQLDHVSLPEDGKMPKHVGEY